MLKKIIKVIICAVWRHKFNIGEADAEKDYIKCLRCKALIYVINAKVSGQWV